MDFTIGKESCQWKVAQDLVDHLYFFGIMSELFTAATETGHIEAALDCLLGRLLESSGNIV